MASPTEAMRKAWAEYGCRADRMQRIAFGPDSILVAPPTVDAWRALARVLEVFGYDIRIDDTDSYNCREIKGGGGKSLHSYGIALDINWTTNPYRDHAGERDPVFSPAATQAERAQDVRLGKADTDMTRRMIDAAIAIKTVDGKRVFGWGGDWRTLKDAMHFQIELTPAELAKGIDWTSVAGGAAAVEPPDFGGFPGMEPVPADVDLGWPYPLEDNSMTLQDGDSGPLVTALQSALKGLNYPPGAIDGYFGPLTRDAVLSFQANNGLPTTGIADAATLKALERGKPRALAQARMNATEEDLLNKGSRIINATGWNRWIGIGTAILGAFGLTDSQTNFVGRIGDALKVAAGATDGTATPEQIAAAVQKAIAAAPAGSTTDQLNQLAQNAIAALTTPGNADVAVNSGGAIIEPIISLGQSLLSSAGLGPWGILLGAGYFIWSNANKAAQARLAEHRTGANLDK